MSISVIIAAYDAEGSIVRAVKSALAEGAVSQVIVVDDASSDGTVGVVSVIDDARLVLIEQAQNAGPAAARNRALEIATGEWIAILDADDFIDSGRFAKMLEAADDYEMVADNLYQVMEGAECGARRLLIEDECDLPCDVSFEGFVRSNLSRRKKERGELGFIKPIIRRDFIERHGLRYQEHMRLGEDYELYCRLLLLGARLRLIGAAGYVAVERAGSLSGSHIPADLRALRDCNEVIALDLGLSGVRARLLRAHALDTDCRLQWRLLIEAVKGRDVMGALRTFLRPWPVPASNAWLLLEQVWVRFTSRLRKT